MSALGKPLPITQEVEPVVRASEPVPSRNARVHVGDVLGGRYRLLAHLGQGGLGMVFEAEDLESAGERVAVKVLTRARPQDLAQLKNEFRALAEVQHPNLVRLHQLGFSRDAWFLAMDLVRGPDFLAYVRPARDVLDERRLRDALPGLLSAVSALHASGMVHRDLKPNNVLVSAEGHVTVIDFGLAREELDEGPVNEARVFVGTPAYAAPEQALAERCGPAADMYALGVMLYEALTGTLPFDGDGLTALLHKLGHDPVPPATRAEGVPADLERLTLRLLSRDPTLRPTAHDMLVELGASRPPRPSLHAAPLFGRDREIDALEGALARSRAEATLVLVHGPSGMGKTSLLRRFSEIAREQAGALVLSGRCYAREQVPFKAFDALVEQLVRHVARLPERRRAAVLPGDLPLLARVFPAFERFLDGAGQGPVPLDLVHVRDRSFRALKELIRTLADDEPLILCLDDLQWGDVDSAALLHELLMQPGAPHALFLCAFRSEERGTSAMLQRLLGASSRVVSEEIALMPLDADCAEQLLCALVPDGAAPERLQRAVRESRGSPFLLYELASLMREGRDSVLPELVSQRGSDLDPAARRLLEVAAVAARPIPLPVALAASGSTVAALLKLIASRLVRLRVTDDQECIEPYHDRLREAVVHALREDDTRFLLSSLARGYAHSHPDQVDVLVEFYQRSGELERAAQYAVRAAELSEASLAFDRAADLYAFAIEYGIEGEHRSSLEIACAAACANAGRVHEAGVRYERAAQLTRDRAMRRELKRKAMRYYLTSGDLEPGDRILGELCREIQLRAPSTSLWRSVLLAWWSYFVYVLGARLRNLPTPTPRAPHSEPSLADERLSLACDAALGLGHHSFVRSSVFVVQALREARKHESAQHWPTALVWEAQLETVARAVPRASSDEAVARAVAFCEQHGDVQEHALVLASSGARDVYLGRLPEAELALERAEALLREHGLPVLSVCNFSRSGRLAVWHATGAFDRVLAHADRWLLEARAMGDPFGELVVHVMGSHRFLALDQPEYARESLRALDEPMGRRSQYTADPWWRADVELYAENVQGALEICRVAHALPLQLAVESTSLHRAWLAFTEARVALSAFSVLGLSRHRSLAKRRLQRLRRQHYAPARPQALTIEAALLCAAGQRAIAATRYAQASQLFAALGMPVYAAGCDFKRGLLMNDHGAIERAFRECTSRGVREPERLLRMLVPGK